MVFQHQLRYNSQLASFITSAEGMLQAKQDKVWVCMESLVDSSRMPRDTCLCLALQVLKLLPMIPLDISFCAPFPMMLTYGPQSYLSQAWLENEEETYSLGGEYQSLTPSQQDVGAAGQTVYVGQQLWQLPIPGVPMGLVN